MNLLTITDKFIREHESFPDEQFGQKVRELCNAKEQSNPPTLHAQMMEIYDQWIIEKLGVGAKINGKEGAAMKQLIEYLKKEVKEKTDEGVLNSFKYILENWDKLSNFTRLKMTLSDINSNLINILAQLRNAGNNKARETAKSISEWDGK